MRQGLVRLAAVAAVLCGERAWSAPFAFICEPGGFSVVSRIDLATNEAVRVPAIGMAVAGTLDGRYGYASFRFDETVTVIDFDAGAVVAAITVPGFPDGLAVTPDGTKVYVAVQQGLSVIDTATKTVVRTIPLGNGNESDVIVNHAGTRVYVGRWDATVGSVSVIDTATDTAVADILVSLNSGMPWSLAIDRSDTRLYVPILDRPEVRVVDLTTSLAIGTISTCASGCGLPFGAAVGADGDRLYVSLVDVQQVAVFALPSGAEVTRIPFADQPSGLDVSPDGTRLYVVNRQPTPNLAIVDTATDGVLGDVLFVGESPMSYGHFIVPGPTTTTTTTPTSSTTTTTGAIPARAPEALRCQDAIAAGWKRMAPKAHRLLASCFHRMLADVAAGRGTATAAAACRSSLDPGLASSSLAKTRATVRGQILSGCSGVTPSAVGSPCAPAAVTAAEIADCVLDAQVATVTRAAAAEHAEACQMAMVAGLAAALPGLCAP